MIWLKKLLICHYTTPYSTRMANIGDEFDNEVSFLWYDIVYRRYVYIIGFLSQGLEKIYLVSLLRGKILVKGDVGWLVRMDIIRNSSIIGCLTPCE